MLQTLCAERTSFSCIKVRITRFNSDVQSVPAVPSTALTVTLPSSQGAWQLTDLGMGFGTWCTVPIYLGPSAVTSLTGAGQKDSSGPWKAPQIIIQVGNKAARTPGLWVWWGHTSGVSDNSKGSEEITPDFVFVTQANGRVFHGDSNKVFSKEKQMNVTFIINKNTVYKTI